MKESYRAELARRISEKTGICYDDCFDVVGAYWRMIKEACVRFNKEEKDPRRIHNGILLRGIGTFSAYPGVGSPQNFTKKKYD